MAEIVYVPVIQDMREEDLRAFQVALDNTARENGWAGVFVVMRARPAKPLPATGGL